MTTAEIILIGSFIFDSVLTLLTKTKDIKYFKSMCCLCVQETVQDDNTKALHEIEQLILASQNNIKRIKELSPRIEPNESMTKSVTEADTVRTTSIS